MCIARRGVQAFHPRGWSLICPHYTTTPGLHSSCVPCHDHDEGVDYCDGDGDGEDGDGDDTVDDVGGDGDDGDVDDVGGDGKHG